MTEVTKSELEVCSILITVLAMQSIVIYADGSTDLIDVAVAGICLAFSWFSFKELDGGWLGRIANSLLSGGSLVYSFGALVSYLVKFMGMGPENGDLFVDADIYECLQELLGKVFSWGNVLSLFLALIIFLISLFRSMWKASK